MRFELFSLLCLHSFQTGAAVTVHVQLKLTLIVCLQVGFSQESVRVKTLLARHVTALRKSDTSTGIVKAAQ